jgi:hypothetical protein
MAEVWTATRTAIRKLYLKVGRLLSTNTGQLPLTILEQSNCFTEQSIVLAQGIAFLSFQMIPDAIPMIGNFTPICQYGEFGTGNCLPSPVGRYLRYL